MVAAACVLNHEVTQDVKEPRLVRSALAAHGAALAVVARASDHAHAVVVVVLVTILHDDNVHDLLVAPLVAVKVAGHDGLHVVLVDYLRTHPVVVVVEDARSMKALSCRRAQVEERTAHEDVLRLSGAVHGHALHIHGRAPALTTRAAGKPRVGTHLGERGQARGVLGEGKAAVCASVQRDDDPALAVDRPRGPFRVVGVGLGPEGILGARHHDLVHAVTVNVTGSDARRGRSSELVLQAFALLAPQVAKAALLVVEDRAAIALAVCDVQHREVVGAVPSPVPRTAVEVGDNSEIVDTVAVEVTGGEVGGELVLLLVTVVELLAVVLGHVLPVQEGLVLVPDEADRVRVRVIGELHQTIGVPIGQHVGNERLVPGAGIVSRRDG